MKHLSIIFLLLAFSTIITCAQNRAVTAKDKIYQEDEVEVKPKYPGEFYEFENFIYDNFDVPSAVYLAVYRDRPEKDFVVSFIVETNGQLTNILILQDLGHGSGKELLKAFKKSPNWIPGEYKGHKVRVKVNMPFWLPPPPVMELTKSAIAVPSPRVSTLPDNTNSQGPVKFAPLSANKEKYLFGDKISNCLADTLRFESVKEAFSDRYSILQELIAAVPPDSLKNLTGRIAFQVLIDSTALPCVISVQNELNMEYKALNIVSAISQKTKWTLLSAQKTKKEALSIIIVLVFTEDRVKYQHLAFDPMSSRLVELEASERGKFSRY